MTSKEALLQKERELRKNLQAELETKVKQLDEENNLLKRERNLAKDLQDVLNKNKTRLNDLESTSEKEKTQKTVIQ